MESVSNEKNMKCLFLAILIKEKLKKTYLSGCKNNNPYEDSGVMPTTKQVISVPKLKKTLIKFIKKTYE